MNNQATEISREEMAERLKNMTPEQIARLQMEQCLFCSIVSGKIPAKKVYEDQRMIAILDINPAAKGHLLLVPKKHYMIMPQVSDADMAHLFLVAQKLSQSILRTFKAGGTTVFAANGQAAGQRSQHAMVHLIARRDGDGVLSCEEKLVGSEMAEKVEKAVKGKVRQHLGLDIGSEGEEQESPEVSSDKSADKTSKISFDPTNNPDNEQAGQGRSRTRKNALKKSGSQDSEGSADKEDTKSNDDINLDEIADLFR